jgi:hypothetical protein
MQTTITVNAKAANAQLSRLASAVAGPRRQALMQELGMTHEGTLHDHFRRKGQQPNKRGWAKQNFWGGRILNATAYSGATQDTATVTIADPAFRTHLEGAKISARRTKFLAIPMREEAYGVRPSSGIIADLFFIRSKKAGGFLAREEGGALRIYYRLLQSVTIPKDPEALPSDSESMSQLIATAEDFLQREVAR